MSFKHALASMVFSTGLIFCVATAGSASTIYTYAGNNYTFAKRSITRSMSLSGSFEVAIPLAAGLSNVDVTPWILSFSIADGARVVSSADSLQYVEFRVSTDGSGDISDWAVYLDVSYSPINRIVSCTGAFASTVGPGTGCGSNVIDRTQFNPLPSFGKVSNNPGTWSMPANLPPDCSAAEADLAELWPPDHAFEQVSILGVTDPNGDVVTVTVTGVFQDEAVFSDGGSGYTCPDAELAEGNAVSLRRERSGLYDGRTYHLEFSADDGQGGACTGSVAVCTPSDETSVGCIDQGPLFDSLGCDPCPAGI
jgi:hypothetical protein